MQVSKRKKPSKDVNSKNDSDSNIETLSDSSEIETRFRVVLSPKKSKKPPKNLTLNSSQEEVHDDTETAASFDAQTAELLSQLEEFNPQLRLKDIYVYPNQTSFDLPPKTQPVENEPVLVELESSINEVIFLLC